MRPTIVKPTGQERRFSTDEFIVSKTDLKGIIRYANDVFLRVSAADEADLIGKPHNVIRHPDMPRAVYKLLWDGIQARREVFAYVLNLAFDGAHYWIFAHVTPSFGPEGAVVAYHSNRRSPDQHALSRVQPLYAKLRAEERRHANASDALAASTDLFESMLAGLGQTYDEFVWTLSPEDGRS